MTIESVAKFGQKLTCAFKNDMGNLENFHQSTFESLATGTFIQSRKWMSLKFTGNLCVMTMKNDQQFEEELTCQFKVNMGNLTNCDPST